MLKETERLAAIFTKLCDDDVKTLASLNLIDRYTTEEQVKLMRWCLHGDAILNERSDAICQEAAAEAKAENPDPPYGDPNAWFHIMSDHLFYIDDAIAEMTPQERDELRKRVLQRVR